MTCATCTEMLDAMIDGELTPAESADVRRHIAECSECARRLEARTALSAELKQLPRFTAPDMLRARVRSPGAPDLSQSVAPPRRQMRWLVPIAAALVVAVVGIGLLVRGRPESVGNQVVASHIRSLMPGHLTDVLSTDQHTVKPWFNGRVNLSPATPNLDSAGFRLIGGRLDYVDGKTVAVVVYGRRQHVINVFSWPETGDDRAPSVHTTNGFHAIYSRQNGVEQWIVSDLNREELDDFSRRYAASAR